MLILTNKSLTKMSSEIQPWSEKPKGKLKWSLKKGRFLAAIMYMLWFIFIRDCNFIYLFLTWQCIIVSLKWNWIEHFQLLHILLVTGDFIQFMSENFELPFRHKHLWWATIILMLRKGNQRITTTYSSEKKLNRPILFKNYRVTFILTATIWSKYLSCHTLSLLNHMLKPSSTK